MAKQRTLWYCTSCGNESSKWMGQCPACKEWNTMVEAPVKSQSAKTSLRSTTTAHNPVLLKDIKSDQEPRKSLGNSELDRLLGGGIVPGSLVLIGGEPGIGKSTLSLQIPLYSKGLKTLYVTGEESEKQVKMRAERIGGDDSLCSIYAETRMDDILEKAVEFAPDLMIVDSVQTMYCDNVESSADCYALVKRTESPLY